MMTIGQPPILGFIFLLAIFPQCLSIRFFISPGEKRCLKHEMYSNQLAVGEYEVTSMVNTKLNMVIKDSIGHIALDRENIDGSGKFAFTSDGADYYELCFIYEKPDSSIGNQSREVNVDFQVGADAKQYDSAIDHDKISDMEKDLTRIEDLTNSIIFDFTYLKKREREMRDTNDSTNTRLFYQSVTSVIILLVLATWQILYLRTFFRARKLID